MKKLLFYLISWVGMQLYGSEELSKQSPQSSNDDGCLITPRMRACIEGAIRDTIKPQLQRGLTWGLTEKGVSVCAKNFVRAVLVSDEKLKAEFLKHPDGYSRFETWRKAMDKREDNKRRCE